MTLLALCLAILLLVWAADVADRHHGTVAHRAEIANMRMRLVRSKLCRIYNRGTDQ